MIIDRSHRFFKGSSELLGLIFTNSKASKRTTLFCQRSHKLQGDWKSSTIFYTPSKITQFEQIGKNYLIGLYSWPHYLIMCVRAVIELGLAAGSTYSKNLPELMDMFSNEGAF